MSNKPRAAIDFAALQESIRLQFAGLDVNEPAEWPVLPRALALLSLTCLVAGGLWYFWVSDFALELEREAAKEVQLKTEFKTKLTQAANLEFLKKQRDEVQGFVAQLEGQLPSRAEMAALLSSINQAGQKRNLQFDLFRPGVVLLKPYYAELPITVRVTGSYHDFGRFASDVAFLPRIATLGNISIAAKTDTSMVFDATIRTYRYLDADEAAAQLKPAVETKK
jgi:type IV pilus assembly protein PilO